MASFQSAACSTKIGVSKSGNGAMLHPQPKIVLVMYMCSSYPCESILPSYVEPVETNLVQRDQYTTHLDTISS